MAIINIKCSLLAVHIISLGLTCVRIWAHAIRITSIRIAPPVVLGMLSVCCVWIAVVGTVIHLRVCSWI